MSVTLRMKDGDIFFDPNTGKSEIIDGPNKASQDIAEVLLTPLVQPDGSISKRSMTKSTYGSELEALNAPTTLTNVVGRNLISIKVSEAINRLKGLQLTDPSATADERIDSILSLEVQELAPGDFAFWVLVQLESGAIAPERIMTVSLRHQQSHKVYKALNEIAQTFVTGSRVG